MKVASDLNAKALRRPQAKSKVCSDKEFMDAVIASEGKFFTRITTDAKVALNMSRTTCQMALNRLIRNGLIKSPGGLYWVEGSKVHNP